MELPTKMEGSDRVVTISYDFGENLESMRQMLVGRGAEDPDMVIFSHARANMKVACRSVAKSCMKKTGDDYMDDAAIQVKIDKWTPSVATEGSPATKEKKISAFEKVFDAMSPEEQLQYLEDLRTKLAAANG